MKRGQRSHERSTSNKDKLKNLGQKLCYVPGSLRNGILQHGPVQRVYQKFRFS